MKLLLVIWAIVSMIGVAASVWMIYRKTHPKPCDTCKNLVMKNGQFHWKYSCKHKFIGDYGGFDKAPDYCIHHEPREEKNQ